MLLSSSSFSSINFTWVEHGFSVPIGVFFSPFQNPSTGEP